MIIDEFFRSSGKKTRDRNNLVVACLESDFRASKEYRMETKRRGGKERIDRKFAAISRLADLWRRGETRRDAQKETQGKLFTSIHRFISSIYLSYLCRTTAYLNNT